MYYCPIHDEIEKLILEKQHGVSGTAAVNLLFSHHKCKAIYVYMYAFVYCVHDIHALGVLNG